MSLGLLFILAILNACLTGPKYPKPMPPSLGPRKTRHI